MTKVNKICLCCGKKYSYCTSCHTPTADTYWKNMWDTENCKKVFMIISDYKANVLTADEAKNKLAECDISDKNSFKDSIVKALKEIGAVSDKKEVTSVEEVAVENKNDTDFKPKKRNRFVNNIE